jgi:arylsulfatase A-like enzyme
VLSQILQNAGYYTKGDLISNLILPHIGFHELDVHDECKDDLTARHRRMIQKVSRKSPFFLYLHYSYIHTALVKNILNVFDQYDERFFYNFKENSIRYSRLVSNAGNYLEKIIGSLRDNRLDENTILVILTDHGSSIGERPGERAYGVYLYDYTVRTFCYLLNNRLLPQGLEIPEQVRSIDIMPTLLELVGAQCGNEIDGQSLMKAIHDKSGFNKEAFMQTAGLDGPNPSPYTPNVHAIRANGWKYIFNSTTGDKELYCIEKDKKEANNLFDKFPELIAIFHSRLDKLRGCDSSGSDAFCKELDDIIKSLKVKKIARSVL